MTAQSQIELEFVSCILNLNDKREIVGIYLRSQISESNYFYRR